MTPLTGKYLLACFNGLKDRNAVVRKYNATAIGHLIGTAKVSFFLIFSFLSELFMIMMIRLQKYFRSIQSFLQF